MRDFIDLVEAIVHRAPYPKRQGQSAKAWVDFIVAVVNWKKERYGDGTWEGLVEDDLGKAGTKIAELMAGKGMITFETNVETLTGLPVRGAFGRHIGWGGTSREMRFVIKPGPNFPQG